MPTKSSESEKSRKSTAAIYIFHKGQKLHSVVREMAEEYDGTIRDLFRGMIETIAADPSIRKQFVAFINDHGSDPRFDLQSKSRSDKKLNVIRIRQTFEVAAVAESVAFRLIGHGNVSDLGRNLITFFYHQPAARRQLFKRLSDGTSASPASKEFTPIASRPVRETKVRYSYTLDKESRDLLGALVKDLQLRFGDVITYLVEKYTTDKKSFEKWLDKIPADRFVSVSETNAKRVNLTEQIDSLIALMSIRIFGTANKSGLIRALIHFEAAERGLVKLNAIRKSR